MELVLAAATNCRLDGSNLINLSPFPSAFATTLHRRLKDFYLTMAAITPVHDNNTPVMFEELAELENDFGDVEVEIRKHPPTRP